MTGLMKDVYLYKGSEVDNEMANYLIDEIYRNDRLLILNTELKAMDFSSVHQPSTN